MSLTVEEWHQRFTQQAEWTSPLRDYCFKLPGISAAGSILEVGCGTGVITSDLHRLSQASVTGVDIQYERLAYAHRVDPLTIFYVADANHLPFGNPRFHVVVCHYFLLWCLDPVSVLAEMRRVAAPGGWLLVLAEPDYSHRTDEPAELKSLGAAQTDALRWQGAHPDLGMHLPELIRQSGWNLMEAGVFQPPSPQLETQLPDGWDLEWKVLEDDLEHHVAPVQLSTWKELDRRAWLAGTRRLEVPTHYAIAQSPLTSP